MSQRFRFLRPLALAYAILVLVIIVAFIQNAQLSAQLEAESIARTKVICESQNELQAIVEDILRTLLAPRDTDEEGQQLERQRLFEEVQPQLAPSDCPPPPPPPSGRP